MKKPLISILAPVLALVCAAALCACSSGGGEPVDPTADAVRAVISVRDYGDVQVELYPNAAPQTVANFIELVRSGFYDGCGFHRVLPGFVVQTGEVRDTSRPVKAVKGEFADNGFDNPVSHALGTLSMARRDNNYDSGTTQFFITVADRPDLDGHYAAFGRVTGGMDVVLRVADESVAADSGGTVAPEDQIIIDSIRIIEDNGQEETS